MRVVKNCLFVCMIAAMVVSCNVLDQKPKLGIDADEAITDAKSAQSALNGLYGLMKANYYGAEFQIISDVSSDISQAVGTYNAYRALDTYTFTPTIWQSVIQVWEAAYRVINQANYIIAAVTALEEIDQDTKERILGEAYFIRALAYFDLNRGFGGVKGVYGSMGVPLILEPTRSIKDIDYPSRASINEVYAQIESDLKKAVELLSGRGDPTRGSEAAAKALLSRLYLYYKQDYALVEQYATSVIEDYDYELTDNYAAIFIKEKTVGSIFEVAANVTDNTSFRHLYYPATQGGRHEIALGKRFVTFMQSRPQDERSELIAFLSSGNVYYPTKYQKKGGSDNAQILRLAEMYLNRAEARAKLGNLAGALSDVNAIRNRAGLPDTTGSGVDTREEILHLIAVERMAEFFEEGHRWFNLVRTGRALNVLTNLDRANGPPVSLEEPSRLVWPIPQRVINTNKNIKQNPGY